MTLTADDGEEIPETTESLLAKVVNPEVEKFGRYFSERTSGEPLSSFEKEIIKAYLWYKLRVDS